MLSCRYILRRVEATIPLRSLYAEDYATAILENLNLHYVATTRPRQALFIYY
jgi:ATP-dependent exoDNAse (exonuclease V) beta subunit